MSNSSEYDELEESDDMRSSSGRRETEGQYGLLDDLSACGSLQDGTSQS